MVWGWQLKTSGRGDCQLVDIQYHEFSKIWIDGDDGRPALLFTETYWLTDEYGNKQEYFDQVEQILEGNDAEDQDYQWPGFPYYRCDRCKRYLQSWEEAKIHVGEDDDVDDAVLRYKQSLGYK